MDNTPTAFPWTHDNVTCTGMTLRDYFAAKAMSTAVKIIMRNHERGDDSDWDWSDSKILSELSYTIADAMMETRNEEPEV